MSEREPSLKDFAAGATEDIRGVLAQLGPSTELGRARRNVLPTWIKVFSWMFLLIGGAVPMVVVVGLIRRTTISVALFGFQYSGSALDLEGLLLAGMLAGCGVTAYGLLWGRSWGQFAAIATGWAGLALCIASVFVRPGLNIPLEPFLLIPFVVAMHRRKAAWNEAAGD